MTTAPPHRSHPDHTNTFLNIATGGARLLRQGPDALLQAIDASLTAVFLLANLALAASLVATAAGLALAPPP
jgi:hypothetical protein